MPRTKKLDINNYGQANGQLTTELTHCKCYILVAGKEYASWLTNGQIFSMVFPQVMYLWREFKPLFL